jgi:hypothetical protein
MGKLENIEEDLNLLRRRMSILETRKEIFKRMDKMLSSLSQDEKQALYELLDNESLEGNLGWSN